MSRSHAFPHPLASAAILVTWLILNSTIAIGHLVLGALLGWGIPWLTRAVWDRPARMAQPMLVMRLLAVVLADIVIANIAVARLILGPVSRLRPTFIEVPLDITDTYAIWALASIITLTPGTVSARLDPDRTLLLVHVLDTDDAAALIAEIKHRYEAPLKEIFEC